MVQAMVRSQSRTGHGAANCKPSKEKLRIFSRLKTMTIRNVPWFVILVAVLDAPDAGKYSIRLALARQDSFSLHFVHCTSSA